MRLASTNVVVSWRDYSWPDYLAGFVLESRSNLVGMDLWQTNKGVLGGNRFSFTNSTSGVAKFFRLRQGP